jgi:hypothetical protein
MAFLLFADIVVVSMEIKAAAMSTTGNGLNLNSTINDKRELYNFKPAGY